RIEPYLSRNTGDCAHNSSGRNLADGEGPRVRHIDVARTIGSQAERGVEPSFCSTPVDASDRSSRPGERGHLSRWADLADSAVARIGHIDVSRAVRGHTGRIVEGRCRPGAISAPGYSR